MRDDDDFNEQSHETDRPTREGGSTSVVVRWTVAFETNGIVCTDSDSHDSHDGGGGDTHADTATNGNAREGERGVCVFIHSRARV